MKNPAALVRSLAPGHPIQYLDSRQIRIRTNPSDLNQDGTPIDNIVFHYNSALRAIHEVGQSVAHFQFMEENGRVVDLRGTPIPNGYAIDPHYLLGENQKSHLGDFWRVLRHCPATNALKSSNPDIEYVPNNTYSFYQFKKTSVQSARVQVKPSRYCWDERPAKDIPDDIFYSLCDFWPSMPIDVDIINENTLLDLPLYRMNEQSKTNHARPGARAHMVNDNSYTIEFLLSTGAINNEQRSFEDYVTAIQELEMKYSNHITNWPFLAAQRLLKLQMHRLKTIRVALTERLDHYPSSGADSAGFNNPDPNVGNNPSDVVMNEGQAASAENIDLMLFRRGEADGENSQSEIRPGQQDPGGWEF